MTSAEQIRKMTDEQLAYLLANISAASVARKKIITVETFKNWLKREWKGKL